MPDIVTHASLAWDVLKEIENVEIHRILEDNKAIFTLGAQGPDVFYFNRIFSIKKDKTFHNFANVMHDSYTNEFIIESIKFLKKNYHVILHCYIMGLLCHHALDRIAHPYVYHVTGKESLKYRGNHMRLERAIDSLFLIDKYHCQPHRYKLHKKILDFSLNKEIFIPFYDEVIKKVYKKKHGGKVFINSSKNFRLYIRLIYDPWGIKKRFAKFIDQYFNKRSKIVLETLFYYQNIDKKIDYLNSQKKEWSFASDDLIKSNESFVELYEKAIKEVKEEIGVVYQYLEGSINDEDLKLGIKDLSYSTGLKWKYGNKMRYFNIIFK